MIISITIAIAEIRTRLEPLEEAKKKGKIMTKPPWLEVSPENTSRVTPAKTMMKAMTSRVGANVELRV